MDNLKNTFKDMKKQDFKELTLNWITREVKNFYDWYWNFDNWIHKIDGKKFGYNQSIFLTFEKKLITINWNPVTYLSVGHNPEHTKKTWYINFPMVIIDWVERNIKIKLEDLLEDPNILVDKYGRLIMNEDKRIEYAVDECLRSYDDEDFDDMDYQNYVSFYKDIADKIKTTAIVDKQWQDDLVIQFPIVVNWLNIEAVVDFNYEFHSRHGALNCIKELLRLEKQLNWTEVFKTLSNDDVIKVAKDLWVEVSWDRITEILERYPEAIKKDPNTNWNIIIERMIYNEI